MKSAKAQADIKKQLKDWMERRRAKSILDNEEELNRRKYEKLVAEVRQKEIRLTNW